MRKLFQKYRSLLISAASVAALYLFFFLVGITCPIRFLTGISCAGCGMTRAWLHLLKFELSEAFAFHPLFWTVPIALLCFFLKNKLPRTCKLILTVIAVLFMLVYMVRLTDSSCTIVVFEPQNGLIYRIIHSLIAWLNGCCK